MPRWFKYTGISLGALVAVAAIAVVVVVNTVDLEHYARLAVERVQVATGRELRIGGKLSVGVFPQLRIAADDVRFANAPWGSRKDMVRVKRVEGALSLVPLLRGRIEIARLELIEPDVLLETNAKGMGNWVFSPKSDAPTDAGENARGPGLGIWALGIDDGTLTYRPAGKAPAKVLLQRVRLKERIFGSIDDVEVEGAFRDQRFTFKGSTGTIAALLDKAGGWPVDLAFATDGAKATLSGRIDWSAQPLAVDAELKAEVRDTSGLGRLAGMALGLPTPLALDARLESSGDERRADPIKLSVGKTSAQGRILVRTGGARPFVSAEFKSRELDLSREGKRNPAPKSGRIFSDAPFPLDALRSIDGQATIAIDRLVLPSALPLEKVDVRATLKAGRLDVQPLSALVGGGTAAGTIVLNAAAGRLPALSVQVGVRQVQLERLAKAMRYANTITGGSTDASIALHGPGESMRRFMGGANGELRLSTGPARLSGIALDAGGDAMTRVFDAVNPARRTDPHTDLRCAAVRLPVRDGIATAQRSIAFETARINVAAAGTINFRSEALDLAIRPTVKEGLGIGVANLAELVKVNGTIADPSIGLDTLASAKAALTVGGAILTGGLSLLGQRLLDPRESDSNPCRTALAGGAQAAPPPAAAGKPSQQQDGVLGSIRRLFQ